MSMIRKLILKIIAIGGCVLFPALYLGMLIGCWLFRIPAPTIRKLFDVLKEIYNDNLY